MLVSQLEMLVRLTGSVNVTFLNAVDIMLVLAYFSYVLWYLCDAVVSIVVLTFAA